MNLYRVPEGGQALLVVATEGIVDGLGCVPVVESSGHVVDAVFDDR